MNTPSLHERVGVLEYHFPWQYLYIMHCDRQQQHQQQLKLPATMASIFGVFVCIFVSTAGGFRNGIDANAAVYFGRVISTGSYQHFGGYSPASNGRTTSTSLQAVLSLKQTMDLIKETVLLSDIVGHYVKDIQPKGRSDKTKQNTTASSYGCLLLWH